MVFWIKYLLKSWLEKGKENTFSRLRENIYTLMIQDRDIYINYCLQHILDLYFCYLAISQSILKHSLLLWHVITLPETSPSQINRLLQMSISHQSAALELNLSPYIWSHLKKRFPRALFLAQMRAVSPKSSLHQQLTDLHQLNMLISSEDGILLFL